MTTLIWTVKTPKDHDAAAEALIISGWKIDSSRSRPGTSVWTKGRTTYVVETNANG